MSIKTFVNYKNYWLQLHCADARREGFLENTAYHAMKKCGYSIGLKILLNGKTGYIVKDNDLELFSLCIKVGRLAYDEQGFYGDRQAWNWHDIQCIECHMIEHLCPEMAIKNVYMLLEKDKEIWNERGRNRYIKEGEAYLQLGTLFQSWKFELLERLGESTDAYRFFKKIYAQ